MAKSNEYSKIVDTIINQKCILSTNYTAVSKKYIINIWSGQLTSER